MARHFNLEWHRVSLVSSSHREQKTSWMSSPVHLVISYNCNLDISSQKIEIITSTINIGTEFNQIRSGPELDIRHGDMNAAWHKR